MPLKCQSWLIELYDLSTVIIYNLTSRDLQGFAAAETAAAAGSGCGFERGVVLFGCDSVFILLRNLNLSAERCSASGCSAVKVSVLVFFTAQPVDTTQEMTILW